MYAPGYSNEKKIDKKFIESVTGIQVELINQHTASTIVINNEIIGDYSFSIWNNVVNPLFIVTDKKSILLGTLKDTSAVAFARKTFSDHTSWFISLPPANASLWRYIFQQAGAHIYNNSGDVFYSGGGILTVHTASGGEREILLRSGKRINLRLPKNSTTLIDPGIAEVVMQ
jgi:hypothetical protein